MNPVIKTRMEIEKQMEAAGLLFNVESRCEAEDKLIESAEYVTDVYIETESDCSMQEAVESWIFDTKNNYPDFFRKIEKKAETSAR